MIISKFCVSMFVINATCNSCRLVALYFGALNVVLNTCVFLGFFLLTKSGLNLKSPVATLSRPTWGHTITSVHYAKFIELSLGNSTAASVASASISVRLDYINSILYGTSTKQITRQES